MSAAIVRDSAQARIGLKPFISIVFGPVSCRQEEFSVFVKNGVTEN
jgi:hypothetical protein